MRYDARVPAGALILFSIAVSLASLTEIASYDYFWHLATGRWITERMALPATDPFSVASDPVAWINGSWLFQVGQWAVVRAGGHEAASVARALLIGLLFALAFASASRRGPWPLVLVVTAVGWYGGFHRFGARPELVATLLLVIAIHLLLRDEEERGWHLPLAYALLTVVWINIHPSALLAPLLAAAVAAGRSLSARPALAKLGRRALIVVLSAAALLVNPYFHEAVLAPLRLASFVTSGVITNLEWLPSTPLHFPLLYVCIVGGALLFAVSPGRRRHLPEILLFVFLSLLAIRFVRNHGYFFAALPLMVAPLLPPMERRSIALLASGTAALILAAGWASHPNAGIGIDDDVFPVRAVDRLKQIDPGGNIYNPDQFGGYLIWRFYPQRRVLVDGRNELYPTLLAEYEEARLDSRKWNRLLAKYDIRIAVEEYRQEPMEVLDAASGGIQRIPASRVYFPLAQWALVAFDDDAMIFVRRNAVSEEYLAAHEYRGPRPDAVIGNR